jgi:hypothetical protein
MLILAVLSAVLIVVAAALAVLSTGYAYAGRDVPSLIDWGAAIAAFLSLVLHAVAQLGGTIRDDFMIAAPFLLLAVGGLAVLAVQRQRRHRRLPRRATLLPTALLLVATILIVKGVSARQAAPLPQLPGQAPAATDAA